MPATVTLAGPVARRVYAGRLVSVCFDAGNPAAIALGDLAACVPGFGVLPEMCLYGLPVIHRCVFVPIATAWEWVGMYKRHRQETPRQELTRILQWAEQQEAPA